MKLAEELQSRPVEWECRLALGRAALGAAAPEEALRQAAAATALAAALLPEIPDWRGAGLLAAALASPGDRPRRKPPSREAVERLAAERTRQNALLGEETLLEDPRALEIWQGWLLGTAETDGLEAASARAAEADWPPLLDWLAARSIVNDRGPTEQPRGVGEHLRTNSRSAVKWTAPVLLLCLAGCGGGVATTLTGGSVPIGGRAITATALLPDGTPVANATVTVRSLSSGQVLQTTTTECAGPVTTRRRAVDADLDVTIARPSSNSLELVIPAANIRGSPISRSMPDRSPRFRRW